MFEAHVTNHLSEVSATQKADRQLDIFDSVMVAKSWVKNTCTFDIVEVGR